MIFHLISENSAAELKKGSLKCTCKVLVPFDIVILQDVENVIWPRFRLKHIPLNQEFYLATLINISLNVKQIGQATH